MTSLPIHPHSDRPERADLDPANQSLADALHRSFRILKLLMVVLVILYLLSGWFSVKPNEVAMILRCGRIVGTDAATNHADAVLGPGWHWSWPYPIDRWETVPTSEREIPIQFMFELSDEEKASGNISGFKYGTLSPMRDDYLITGDVNILHAALVLKYRITDPVAYLTNIHPMPDPSATARSRPWMLYPEYTLLSTLARDAVIETASLRHELDIRGARQSDFQIAVAQCLIDKLKTFQSRGLPLGISIDPAGGVLAPKTSGIEGILPPRQVQMAFEAVDRAISTRVITVTKAASAAQSLYLKTAGPEFDALADAVQAEFEALRKCSALLPNDATSDACREELARRRAEVEEWLRSATGDVRNIIKNAQIRRDQIVKEAAGDYDQFMAVLPEYQKNPDIFISQMLAETFAAALSNREIGKTFVPDSGRGFWLQIPRTPVEAMNQNAPKVDTPGVIDDPTATRRMN